MLRKLAQRLTCKLYKVHARGNHDALQPVAFHGHCIRFPSGVPMIRWKACDAPKLNASRTGRLVGDAEKSMDAESIPVSVAVSVGRKTFVGGQNSGHIST